MADTFLQMHVHLVFATKNRNAIIGKDWKDDLEKYITGVIQNQKHKMLAINLFLTTFIYLLVTMLINLYRNLLRK